MGIFSRVPETPGLYQDRVTGRIVFDEGATQEEEEMFAA